MPMSIRCAAAGWNFHLLLDLGFVGEDEPYKSSDLLAVVIFLWILANIYSEVFYIGFLPAIWLWQRVPRQFKFQMGLFCIIF